MGSDDAHIYTITDNDKPNIDFNTTSSNGDESVSSADLTVDLSATYTQNITVDYVITGTATGSGTDYTLADGTLSISAGEKTGTITITDIVDDGLAEENETVIITLSSPNNATLGNDSVHTYTITNDDESPVLTKTSPQDDSTGVPINSDIILTFSKAVNCKSGTINVESEDNSPSFAVSLPNENVTGCGTEIITINLPTDLEHETEYYVLIENNAFELSLIHI